MSKRIEISLDGLHKLEKRIDDKHLESSDWPIIGALVSNLALREQGKLERMLAKVTAQATQTDSAQENPEPPVQPTSELSRADQNQDLNGAGSSGANTTANKNKGHGRNGASSFTNAKHFFVSLAVGILGSLCLACGRGRMRRYRDRVVIRVVGQPIFQAEIHRAEQVRCRKCGQMMSATLPAGIHDGIGKHVTYHWTACAMLLVIHYTAGMPFKRLESLHESWGIPFADANQWEVVNESVQLLMPLLKAIERHAITRALNLKIDDTGAMVIEIQRQIVAELEQAKALGLSEDTIRTGINATCARIQTPESVAILFFTGRHHAGEIIDQILQSRSRDSDKIIKVTDGASKNFDHAQSDKVIEATCNAHAFLKFHDVKAQFPAEYAIAGEAYHHVFENDAVAAERNMTQDERLSYHQKHSAPWMEKLKNMCTKKIESRLVEPRSPLWEPVTFFINQWARLTRFLEVPGVPLDTNLVEQNLIIPVRYLAASFNFQNTNGSEVGDAAMSLTATARACGVEPVTYIAYCLENHKDLKNNPEKYLPWVYRETIHERDKPPDSLKAS